MRVQLFMMGVDENVSDLDLRHYGKRLQHIGTSFKQGMQPLDPQFLSAIQFRLDNMLGDTLKNKSSKIELFSDINLCDLQILLKDKFNVNIFEIEEVRSVGAV